MVTPVVREDGVNVSKICDLQVFDLQILFLLILQTARRLSLMAARVIFPDNYLELKTESEDFAVALQRNLESYVPVVVHNQSFPPGSVYDLDFLQSTYGLPQSILLFGHGRWKSCIIKQMPLLSFQIPLKIANGLLFLFNVCNFICDHLNTHIKNF
jgi:hypothetical protein